MATLVLEHSDLTGSEHLGEVLRDHGHRLDVRRLHRGDAIPADLDELDAIVTCGGGHSALDDDLPWLAPEMDLLRDADTAALPVVAICLGAQILTRALGGAVGPLENGIECGWHEVTLTPTGREDPMFAGQPWRGVQPHWHRDHVTTPPPGARVLAKSARTPVQAWALGLRTYAIQYHPEIGPGTLDAWAADEPAALTEAGLSLEDLRHRTEAEYAGFARLARLQFTAMAMLLMPLDRRLSATP